MTNEVRVRPEKPGDLDAIREVNRLAFGPRSGDVQRIKAIGLSRGRSLTSAWRARGLEKNSGTPVLQILP